MRTKREMKSGRNRRKLRISKRIQGSDERPRISIFKSSKYTYAQLISDDANRTIVSASTKSPEVIKMAAGLKIEGAGSEARSTKSVAAARALGMILAERAKEQNIKSVVFDRNGYTYTGRIQAVADGAREGGLEF